MTMSGGCLSNIQPTELKFPFEPNNQTSCFLQLTNRTDGYVAFKVETSNPEAFCVLPNTGVLCPGATCDVTVTMEALEEIYIELKDDFFLVRSVIAPEGATKEDTTPDMFDKGSGKLVEEFKLRARFDMEEFEKKLEGLEKKAKELMEHSHANWEHPVGRGSGSGGGGDHTLLKMFAVGIIFFGLGTMFSRRRG